MMRGIVVAAMAIGLALPGHADMYKCRVNGRLAYQQEPCAAGTAKGTVSTPDAVTDEAARESRTRFEAEQAVRTAAARRKTIDEQIAFQQNSILSYEAMMDSELAALRAKKSQARNNLAGATWEQSISTEMEAVAAKYATKIRIARDEIEALQKERSTLAR
jgi:hypothetical protein